MATDERVSNRPSPEPRPVVPLGDMREGLPVPATAVRGGRGRWRRRRQRFSSLIILVPVALIALFPFYWMVVSALTPRAAAIRVPPSLFPSDATLDNLRSLFETAPVMLWAFNSLVIAAAIMVGHVIFDSMAGYAFARKRFAGKALVFTLIVSSLMIPVHVTLVPRFILITEMGLNNNLLGVIAPSIADVFGIFLMRQFMQSLPRELEEAARVDGANEWQVFRHIVMPLSKPAVATVGIFSFVGAWNAFLWPLIVLSDRSLLTLPVGVALLQQEFSTNIGLQMAGALIGAVPMIILFLLFQRHFLEGVRVGALKG
ncbi:carbohydrate ABC transporter permease [soil metagenome]|jgi:multiple sugar transport system permease protein